MVPDPFTSCVAEAGTMILLHGERRHAAPRRSHTLGPLTLSVVGVAKRTLALLAH